MGEDGPTAYNVGSLAFGALWPLYSRDGQGNSPAHKRFQRTAPSVQALREDNAGGSSECSKPAGKAATATQRAAFRSIYSKVETLRLAAIGAFEAVLTAEAAGLSFPDIVNTLRLDNADWDKELERMQVATSLLEAVGAPTSLDILILTDEPVSKSQSVLDDAFDDGYLAAVIGRYKESCELPYKSDVWKRWMDGYRQCKADMRADKASEQVQ